PVAISFSTFYLANKSVCKIYVPIGSKSLYQTTSYWKDFINIIEMQNTETPQIFNNEISTSYNSLSGTLYLKGLEGSACLVSIYNLFGKKVISTYITDSNPIYVGYLATGAYVIQITNGREKSMTRKMIVP
ncbi:MAG TPA: T9SS type A sorting domain-containing protein, partial [Paludibacter sp.]|nr:T9SS type A sorting domain-containing protein [Paludibacter sp.]